MRTIQYKEENTIDPIKASKRILVESSLFNCMAAIITPATMQAITIQQMGRSFLDMAWMRSDWLIKFSLAGFMKEFNGAYFIKCQYIFTVL